ncbi:Leucine-rich_repeat [Hexamita inflata]|uniref:Leucine-rich repeat n=1 Tax=Hexamita inflata TaxID=28002 RepID=A0AA86PHC1_9EUKA|nr:Leucine-rich repeat [Hexamita inflata]
MLDSIQTIDSIRLLVNLKELDICYNNFIDIASLDSNTVAFNNYCYVPWISFAISYYFYIFIKPYSLVPLKRSFSRICYLKTRRLESTWSEKAYLVRFLIRILHLNFKAFQLKMSNWKQFDFLNPYTSEMDKYLSQALNSK